MVSLCQDHRCNQSSSEAREVWNRKDALLTRENPQEIVMSIRFGEGLRQKQMSTHSFCRRHNLGEEDLLQPCASWRNEIAYLCSHWNQTCIINKKKRSHKDLFVAPLTIWLSFLDLLMIYCWNDKTGMINTEVNCSILTQNSVSTSHLIIRFFPVPSGCQSNIVFNTVHMKIPNCRGRKVVKQNLHVTVTLTEFPERYMILKMT